MRIRAELKSGKVYVGPIAGNGGMIGSGAAHVSHKLASKYVLNLLRLSRERAELGTRLPIFEPKPGHVAIYPDYCAETDGERVEIPFDGTILSVEKS